MAGIILVRFIFSCFVYIPSALPRPLGLCWQRGFGTLENMIATMAFTTGTLGNGR